MSRQFIPPCPVIKNRELAFTEHLSHQFRSASSLYFYTLDQIENNCQDLSVLEKEHWEAVVHKDMAINSLCAYVSRMSGESDQNSGFRLEGACVSATWAIHMHERVLAAISCDPSFGEADISFVASELRGSVRILGRIASLE